MFEDNSGNLKFGRHTKDVLIFFSAKKHDKNNFVAKLNLNWYCTICKKKKIRALKNFKQPATWLSIGFIPSSPKRTTPPPNPTHPK